MLTRSLRPLHRLSLVVFCLLLLSHAAQAQKEKEKKQNAAPAPPAPVKLSVLVMDAAGAPVGTLTQNDFQVIEEGAPQKLSIFNKRDGPVTYGLAIDASGSLRKYMDKVIVIAKTIIAQGGPSEDAFVERFIDSERVETFKEFTSDKNSLEDALDSIYVEGGQSAVIDGVYLAVQHLMVYKYNEPQRRRSLIVITDGEDRASHYTQEELFKLLRDSDIRIYVIGFVQDIPTQKKREKALMLLNRLAYETGGRVFFPDAGNTEPKLYIPTILAGLYAQYTLGYYPASPLNTTPERKVEVKVAGPPNSASLKVIPDTFQFIGDPPQKPQKKH